MNAELHTGALPIVLCSMRGLYGSIFCRRSSSWKFITGIYHNSIRTISVANIKGILGV